jgi:two-component system heavy metal sensor histidine kinase CusS
MKRPVSIALRLNLLFLAVLAIVLAAGSGWIAAAIQGHFEEQDRMEIGGKLAQLRRVAASVHQPDDLAQLTRALDDALVGQHGLYLAVAGAGGAPLVVAPADVFPHRWPDAAVTGAGLAAAPFLRWEHAGVTYRALVEAVPTGLPGAPVLCVGVALDIAHHQMFMEALRAAFGPALLACLVVAGVLTWAAVRRGLAPLIDMAGVAKGISASRLDQRLAVADVPVELVDLATSFNDMLGRLEDSFGRLEAFAADLAHELRTPISNLMIQAQVALSRSRGAADYREVLYSSLEEYDRLARMITDMLFLARADNGLLIPQREALELGAEAAAVAEYFEVAAAERSVRIELHGSGRIAGDRLMIRRAIGNLVSNAVRHATAGTAVRLAIDRAGDEVRLRVENLGECLPAELRARIFDRFYRIDPSRQRASEGAGLGLAIARSIVVAHGGRLEAVAKADGARFELALPAG